MARRKTKSQSRIINKLQNELQREAIQIAMHSHPDDNSLNEETASSQNKKRLAKACIVIAAICVCIIGQHTLFGTQFFNIEGRQLVSGEYDECDFDLDIITDSVQPQPKPQVPQQYNYLFRRPQSLVDIITPETMEMCGEYNRLNELSTTKIIDETQMETIRVSQYQNIKTILSPFLVNKKDEPVKMFKYHDENLSFLVFELQNDVISKWIGDMQTIMVNDEAFHTDTKRATTSLIAKTGTSDLKMVRDKCPLVKAQEEVMKIAYRLLCSSDGGISVKNRFLTNFVDVSMNKWIQKNYHKGLSLSEIRKLSEYHSIHQDEGKHLTFTSFITGNNYGDKRDEDMGMYLFPNKWEKYLIKPRKNTLTLAIFPSHIIHSTQMVHVDEDEDEDGLNVKDETERVWRLACAMQTRLMDGKEKVIEDSGSYRKSNELYAKLTERSV